MIDGAVSTPIVRAILSVPGHMLFAIPMGYFLSISKFEHGNISVYHLLMSLIVHVAFHGSFDFILMTLSGLEEANGLLLLFLFLLFLIFDVYMWQQGLKRTKLHIEKD